MNKKAARCTTRHPERPVGPIGKRSPVARDLRLCSTRDARECDRLVGRHDTVLAVHNLEVVYSDVIPALRGVSLEVPSGTDVTVTDAGAFFTDSTNPVVYHLPIDATVPCDLLHKDFGQGINDGLDVLCTFLCSGIAVFCR